MPCPYLSLFTKLHLCIHIRINKYCQLFSHGAWRLRDTVRAVDITNTFGLTSLVLLCYSHTRIVFLVPGSGAMLLIPHSIDITPNSELRTLNCSKEPYALEGHQLCGIGH